jgi:outer membrane cobalamin receptor
MTWTSSRYADEAGLIVIPAHRSLDFEAEVRTAKEHLAIRARMTNALNEARYDVIGYALAGRSVFGSLEARW